jgi:uncharacterized membrane protein
MRPNTDAWLSLTQNSLILWALLMLPLFVTLETGLLNAQEHGNKMMLLVLALYFQQGEQRAHQDDLWHILIQTSLVL